MILDDHFDSRKYDKKFKRKMKDFLIKYYNLVGFFSVIILAYLFPNIGKTGGLIHAEYSVKLTTIPLIFLFTGASIKTKELIQSLFLWKIHLFIQVYNLLLMPFLVFLVVSFFKETIFSKAKALADGVIIMSCFPTTVGTSAVLTKLAGGNEAVAIFDMVFGNALGLVVTPITLSLFTSSVENFAPASKILMNLSFTVIGPIILGQLLRTQWETSIDHFRTKVFSFSHINNFLLWMLFWTTFCDVFSRTNLAISRTTFLTTAVVIILLHFFFLSLNYGGSYSLDYPIEDKIAILYCSTQKTITGIALMGIFFAGDPDLPIKSLPLVIYHPTQFIVASILVVQFQELVSKQKEKLSPNFYLITSFVLFGILIIFGSFASFF